MAEGIKRSLSILLDVFDDRHLFNNASPRCLFIRSCAVLTTVFRQRCPVHFFRNPLDYLPRKADEEVTRLYGTIYASGFSGKGR
jgi:hypothetical protein